MTLAQDEAVAEPEVRGGTRWGVLLAILALPALLAAGGLLMLGLWLFTDDSVDTGMKQVPCTEALAFGGAKLPAGAYDGSCVRQAGPDTRYEALFRAPRAGVGDWLAATYPDAPQPRTKQCGSDTVDACLDLSPAAGRSASVRVEVTYDGAKWSQVRFVARTP